jgi:hypothetical protein
VSTFPKNALIKRVRHNAPRVAAENRSLSLAMRPVLFNWACDLPRVEVEARIVLRVSQLGSYQQQEAGQ